MFVYSTTRCLFIIFLVIHSTVVGWHDIYDIFHDAKEQLAESAGNAVDYASNKVKEKVQKHVLKLKDGETCPSTFTTEYRTVLTAYRTLIQDWLDKFPSTDAKEYRLLADLSTSEFGRLKRFASASNYEQNDVLHDVHVISDLLKRAVHTVEEAKPIYSGLTWSGWLRSFDINSLIKGFFVLLVIATISFVSIRSHLRRGRWLSTFFIAAFLVSFMQNWYSLYQEAQAKVDHVLMKKLPKHCQGQSMGLFDMFKAKVGRFFQLPVNECLEYHKALRATPHSQVTPFQALSVTMTQLFFTPLGSIGESLSQFFAGTMLHVPIVMWPIVLLVIIFVFVALLLMYFRYEFRLPFMLGSLRPATHAAVTMTNTIQEPQLEDTSNRPSNYVTYLENELKQLRLQLEQQTHPQLEHNSSTSIRNSRSSSAVARSNQRERSSSRRRSDQVTDEDELRQRTPLDIGFKKELFQ